MNVYDQLLDGNFSLGHLESALAKERAHVLTAYRSKTTNSAEWLISKATYCGISNAYKQEMAKFEELIGVKSLVPPEDAALSGQEIADQQTECESNEQNVYTYSAEDSSASEHPTPQEVQSPAAPHQEQLQEPKPVAALHQVPQATAEENKSAVEPTETQVEAESVQSLGVSAPSQSQSQPQREREPETEPEAKKVRPSWGLAAMLAQNSATPQQSHQKRVLVVRSVKRANKQTSVGYKGLQQQRSLASRRSPYKGKPIYSATTLLCRETCGEDEQLLKAYLQEHAGFSPRKITSVQFRSGPSGDFCLFKVRAPKEVIEARIEKLNQAKQTSGRCVIRVFAKASRPMPPFNKRHKTLFVNNFDILNNQCYDKMTRLFSQFGQLGRDIQVRLDKNNDPYATVQFKHAKDARQCCVASKQYGRRLNLDGKLLDVRFIRS